MLYYTQQTAVSSRDAGLQLRPVRTNYRIAEMSFFAMLQLILRRLPGGFRHLERGHPELCADAPITR